MLLYAEFEQVSNGDESDKDVEAREEYSSA